MTEITRKTDAQIQRDVLVQLKWDPRVRETGVGVEVKDHDLTLTVTLDTWKTRVAAQDAAHREARNP
jgi:hypothetical protein